jgi:hypothetical protein
VNTKENRQRLRVIRTEHYPLMVSTIIGWLQMHGDPRVVADALSDACREEQQRMKRLKENGDD